MQVYEAASERHNHEEYRREVDSARKAMASAVLARKRRRTEEMQKICEKKPKTDEE